MYCDCGCISVLLCVSGTGLQAVLVTMCRNVYGSTLLWHVWIETSEGVCSGALEGRIVWGVNRKSRTLSSARSNIMAALGHLGMLTAQTCPIGLLHEVEHVLQVRLARASLALLCTDAALLIPFRTTPPCCWPFWQEMLCHICYIRLIHQPVD